MTEELFREDAYLKACTAKVLGVDGDRVLLDRTVCYPRGGGQPGDCGTLTFATGRCRVTDTVTGDAGIEHVVEGDPPTPGSEVEVEIDWPRRYRHMRMHTALHLLGAVLRFGVTGGNIGESKSRLDFDMEEGVDKMAVQAALDALVEADHEVRCRWISAAELDAQPELVRTLSVAPPRGQGRVRLLEIVGVDLQPCGGTHVRSTAEVGKVRVGKVEKKGRRNRRVNIHIDD